MSTLKVPTTVLGSTPVVWLPPVAAAMRVARSGMMAAYPPSSGRSCRSWPPAALPARPAVRDRRGVEAEGRGPLLRVKPKLTGQRGIWTFPDDLQTLITGESALRPKVTLIEEAQDAPNLKPYELNELLGDRA